MGRLAKDRHLLDLPDGGIQDHNGLVNILLADNQWGHKPDCLRWDRIQQQAPLAAGLGHCQGYRLRELHPQEQAAAPNLLHNIPLLLQAQEPLPEVASHPYRVARQIFLHDKPQDRTGYCRAERIAAIGGAVIAGSETGSPFVRQERGDGNPAAQPLAHRHDVRLDAGDLVSPQGPGSTAARLDLIQDQQDAPLVAERTDLLQIVLRWDVHPALALDRLQQDRTGPLTNGGPQGSDVVERDMSEPYRERGKGRLVLRLARSEERRVGKECRSRW